jgi:phage shock protein C
MERLYRSRDDRIIAGVCGGAGKYFNMDPTIIRLVWAASVFLGGFGLFAYVIAMIIIPEEPKGRKKGGKVEFSEKDFGKKMESLAMGEGQVIGRAAGGLALICIGTLFLLSNMGIFSWWSWTYMWPWTIIAIGLILLLFPRRFEHAFKKDERRKRRR